MDRPSETSCCKSAQVRDSLGELVLFARMQNRQYPRPVLPLYVRPAVQGRSPGFVAVGVYQVGPHLDLMEETAFHSQDLGSNQ